MGLVFPTHLPICLFPTRNCFLFDDLSSALDVETERLLWERIFMERKV
jgi:ATP-binding cassette, subfamily B, bacterial